MIAYIDGKLTYKDPTYVIIDVNGIGYQIKISLSTYSALPDGERCRLHTFLHIKEDAHTLYGFMTAAEKETFLHLISISGVGPNTGLMILSSLTVEEVQQAFAPAQLHEFGMYLKNKWYKMVAKEGTYTDDPIGVLDVSILSNNVLDKILGIADQRTDKRIDFVGGIRGLGELEKRVNSGEMQVAFSLYPVSIEQLFNIADSGNVMPPKSTWFEPKLRDGLLTHMTHE